MTVMGVGSELGRAVSVVYMDAAVRREAVCIMAGCGLYCTGRPRGMVAWAFEPVL